MGLLLWLALGSAHAQWTVNMAPGVTDVSRSVFDLHRNHADKFIDILMAAA